MLPWQCDLHLSSQHTFSYCRYESTIVGQFFGHTHHDSFSVFYDINNSSRPFRLINMCAGLPLATINVSPCMTTNEQTMQSLHQSYALLLMRSHVIGICSDHYIQLTHHYGQSPAERYGPCTKLGGKGYVLGGKSLLQHDTQI